ncbi:hypothetical protein ACFLZG_07070, partial [Thermodesulfobacteriota bacterium]
KGGITEHIRAFPKKIAIRPMLLMLLIVTAPNFLIKYMRVSPFRYYWFIRLMSAAFNEIQLVNYVWSMGFLK